MSKNPNMKEGLKKQMDKAPKKGNKGQGKKTDTPGKGKKKK